tara:strand:- start:435 stop:659 length:225 start_codon:yes stop_codon:yes gene_type:complete
MEFELGQLVTVWVDDLDPKQRKRWKNKYGMIKELIYIRKNHSNRPDIIKVFFPEINETKEFIADRVKPLEEKNA